MFGVLVISACMHERSFKRSQITVSWMLNVGQHKGFYHRVEPVAVIKLNCLNKAFECQAVEWQNERLTHFKDQRKGESLDGNTEGSLPCYLWHSQRETVVTNSFQFASSWNLLVLFLLPTQYSFSHSFQGIFLVQLGALAGCRGSWKAFTLVHLHVTWLLKKFA